MTLYSPTALPALYHRMGDLPYRLNWTYAQVWSIIAVVTGYWRL